MNEAEHIDEFTIRREKLKEITSLGINPYPSQYNKEISINQIKIQFEEDVKENNTIVSVVTAGRIIAKRGHGKASFANIMDDSGKMQIYGKKDILGDDLYSLYVKLDIGDFVGIKGELFITKTGELTIKIQSFQLLSKSLNPFPEKFHGLQDKEIRYRKRYLDLIVNPEIKDVFKTRSKIISFIRKKLEEKEFMEVETPVLHSIAGGATARPFITHHNTLDMQLYLRIALELHLKRLIVGGFEKVFEIGRVFRNEGISFKHNPEYTLLELYQAYSDYNDMMYLTEELISSLVLELTGDYHLSYDEQVLDFKPPWTRITMRDLIKKYANIDIESKSFDVLKKEILAKDIQVKEEFTSTGQLINHLYDEKVEKNLIQPTFVIDYPLETSPLAKKHRNNSDIVERFELVINSMEIANAFSELNDPIDQKQRFEEQLAQRNAGDKEAHMMDEDFIEAIEYGMPPTGGLGIGIDRVVMLLTNQSSIRDVLLFPHMRHK
jgi:lysyl-tRNA synthetase, class II